MNPNVGDILQCEKQLRDALHSDDKEKLRRKLAQLKREYVKTAQRLQRAERLEAVRTHVRSRISEQNHLDHRESEAAAASRDKSPSLILNTTNAQDQGSGQSQEHAPDPDPSRRSQAIRFILPSDPASPQPPDSHHDSGGGHRPSPALRLRSRRSRLRWERRSAEADQSTGISQKELEQSEGIQGALTAEEEEGMVQWRRTDAVNEIEEKLSVEGLLFPVEYYVRTTRRMTSSQSQPDIQAVLFSQLSVGRQRRSRGRGGGASGSSVRSTHSSPATSSTSPLPLNSSFAQPSGSPAGVSPMNSDAGFSPTVTTARPPRGRRKRRGRGRGRSQSPKRSFNWQGSQSPDDVPPSDSLSQSLRYSEEPNHVFSPPEAVKELDTGRHVTSRKIRHLRQSESHLTGHLSSCPPSSSPIQTALLSLPPPSLGSLIGSLKSLDIYQDFHLPDEHFASLKLHKLRQVAVDSGIEHFSTPSGNTRSSLQRSDLSDSWNAVPLLLTSTPTTADLPLPDEDVHSDFPHWSEKLSSSSFTKEQTDMAENVENIHSTTDSLVVVQEVDENHLN
ncbi:hypothetical protein OJAV_G00004020 [Oryzias javanicus]|uniref:Uncharacterized protein n=1 Tax=Oryzias javanicus TaxID=123683 RepID=A0A437DLU9_ORYJA|nr:hypothetical protein OJAV_G00004020 [Oryzias javanicus]